MKLIYMLNHPFALNFVKGQLAYFKNKGMSVIAITGSSHLLEEFCNEEGIQGIGIDIHRSLNPLKDLGSVIATVRHLKRERPDFMHAGTPKGGLIGMISAKVCNVPVRVYHIRGFTFRSYYGWKRILLMLTERVSCYCATVVLAHSNSIRNIAIEEGFVSEGKIHLILNGSNGIDSQALFNPSNYSKNDRKQFRHELGISENDPVVSCIARQMVSKGQTELIKAWPQVLSKFPNAKLLLVGNTEEHEPLPKETISSIEADKSVYSFGRIPKRNVPAFYYCSDLIVLPTYREGFPNVPLEAAAMGLPIVATQVEGCTDAVINGVTGTLVPPKTIEPLAEAITHYLASPELRMKHGNAAQVRVQKEFQSEIIWEAQYDFYLSQLRNA